MVYQSAPQALGLLGLLQDVGGVCNRRRRLWFSMRPAYFFDGQLNELVVLFLGVRRVFTGGPADENGGGAASYWKSTSSFHTFA